MCISMIDTHHIFSNGFCSFEELCQSRIDQFSVKRILERLPIPTKRRAMVLLGGRDLMPLLFFLAKFGRSVLGSIRSFPGGIPRPRPILSAPNVAVEGSFSQALAEIYKIYTISEFKM